jgi:hypothetical protein
MKLIDIKPMHQLSFNPSKHSVTALHIPNPYLYSQNAVLILNKPSRYCDPSAKYAAECCGGRCEEDHGV